MEINDRDLAIIGAGAFLTVLCLLFQWPFVIRIVVGSLILVVFMIVALWRPGPEKLPLEEQITRLLSSSRRPRKYSYRTDQKAQESVAPQGKVFKQPASVPIVPLSVSDESQAPASTNAVPILRPVTFAWEEVGIYRLVTIWLAVIGIYFVYWLYHGGTEQIGHWMKTMFRIP
jgi:hypothetical protein